MLTFNMQSVWEIHVRQCEICDFPTMNIAQYKHCSIYTTVC